MSKSSRYQILSLSKLSSEEPYSVLISITVKRKSQTTEHLHRMLFFIFGACLVPLTIRFSSVLESLISGCCNSEIFVVTV